MHLHVNMLIKCASKYQKRALLEVEVKTLQIRKRLKKTLQQVPLCRHIDPNNKLRVPAYYSSDRLNIYDVRVTFPLISIGQFHSSFCIN